MNVNEEFYHRVVEVTCKVCKVDPIMMFSSNRECFVDARSLVIMILAAKGYTDERLSFLTGLTRQGINRIRNSFPDKYNRSWMLISFQQQISNELAINQQCTSN